MDSILTSIKRLLGIEPDDASFDTEIIIHINSTFMVLRQLGVGPTSGYSITSESETWRNYLGDSIEDYEAVKSYVYLKVQIVFDPPMSASVLESYKQQINEYESRLNIEAES